MSTPTDPTLDTTAAQWFTLSKELLNAIADHPAFPTEGANQSFKDEILAIRDGLLADPSSTQATSTGVDVQEALTRYAGHAEKALGNLTTQLREIAGLLLNFTGSSDGADPKLAELRQSLLSAEDPDTLKALRQEIIERLEKSQQQADAQSKRGEALTEKLQDRVALLENFMSAPAPAPAPQDSTVTTDPCTGLPDWREADRAIQRAQSAGREVSIAVFYVHRMNYVNTRFGSVIGDKVLFVCSQHLATALVRPADALYRWKGPSFLAILEREEGQSHTENDIQRLLATPLSQYLETPSRTVYLPIKLTGHAVPATETSVAAIRDWIDRYILRASVENRLTD
ncbi:MAG: diguanylate cyclase [Bryobacteraceae bacterium]